MAVMVDYVSHVGHASATTAGSAIAVPVAVFVLCVWLLQVRPQHPPLVVDLAYPGTAALALVAVATPWALPLTAVLVALLVAAHTVLEPSAVNAGRAS